MGHSSLNERMPLHSLVFCIELLDMGQINLTLAMIDKLKLHLPILFDLSIVHAGDLQIKIDEYLQRRLKYEETINKRNATLIIKPVCLFDWITLSMVDENKIIQQQAIAFLDFVNQNISFLLTKFPQYSKSIKSKIKDSLNSNTDDSKYENSLAELIFASHVNHHYEDYEFLGFDYKIGNNKDVDFAFKNGEEVLLIEMLSIHNLKRKSDSNVYQRLLNDINKKLDDKIKNKDLVVECFSKQFSKHIIQLCIVLFIWQNVEDIMQFLDDIKKVEDDKRGDLLPILSLRCCCDDKGMFCYDVCHVSDLSC